MGPSMAANRQRGPSEKACNASAQDRPDVAPAAGNGRSIQGSPNGITEEHGSLWPSTNLADTGAQRFDSQVGQTEHHLMFLICPMRTLRGQVVLGGLVEEIFSRATKYR